MERVKVRCVFFDSEKLNLPYVGFSLENYHALVAQAHERMDEDAELLGAKRLAEENGEQLHVMWSLPPFKPSRTNLVFKNIGGGKKC